jgi:trigger factor
LEITLNKKNTTEASITISLKPGDYQSKVEKKVKDYSKKAEIKGFRKGKVPMTMIKNMYGKSILVEEINHMISHGLSDYIKENKLNIIGEPLPNRDQTNVIDWDNQKDFDFEYNVGLVEDFEVDLSKKQKITKNEIKVDKKVIDETIANLKDQYGDMTNPEVSEEGDALYGSFSQTDGDLKSNGIVETRDLGKKDAKKFMGVKKGDKISFDPKKLLSSDEQIAQTLGIEANAVNDLSGEVEIEVINVNRKVAAEINQVFFDKIFGKDIVKDEKEFLEKVEESISKNYEKESGYLLERDIRDHFVSKVKMETPNEFLREWLFISNEGKITKEQIDSEFDLYISELKWSLIRNKIAEAGKVDVSNDEIKAKAIEVLAEQFGGPSVIQQLGDKMDEFADSYLKANDGEHYTTIYNQVAADKVYKYVIENVTINTKKVSLDDFRKQASK